MIKELEKELSDWLRPVSPLTAFYLKVRGETSEQKGATDKTPASGTNGDDSPLKGIDRSELPSDIKAALEKADALLASNKTEKEALEQRRVQAENFARTKQSEADKLKGIVQKHNLPIDGVPPVNPHANTPEAGIESRKVRLMGQGMDEKTASAYAKILSDEATENEKALLSKLAPLVGSVGNMQADQHLSAAKIQYQNVFAVPEVAKAVQDNVTNLVQNGRPVDAATVKHLVSMAWGDYTLTNPDKVNKPNTQGIPQFGSSVSSGVMPNNTSNTQNNNNKEPMATQPETIAIMNSLKAEFDRDLKKGKK
jgi:hypothetical protein